MQMMQPNIEYSDVCDVYMCEYEEYVHTLLMATTAYNISIFISINCFVFPMGIILAGSYKGWICITHHTILDLHVDDKTNVMDNE